MDSFWASFFPRKIFWFKKQNGENLKKKPAAVSPRKLGTASPKKGAKGKAKSSPKKLEKADGGSELEMAEASSEAEPASCIPIK